MARRYKFTTGRYDPSGKRIKGRVETPTQGRLSTMSGLRTGKKTRVAPAKPYTPPQSPKVKKTKQLAGYKEGNEGRPRKVLEYKGSVKTYAQMTLGKYVKAGKLDNIPKFGDRAFNFKESVIAMAEQNRVPEWMLRKLRGMDENALYLLGQVEGNTIEVYFDYGDLTDDNIAEQDLFWSPKWDDVEFLINQYERAYGPIESER